MKMTIVLAIIICTSLVGLLFLISIILCFVGGYSTDGCYDYWENEKCEKIYYVIACIEILVLFVTISMLIFVTIYYKC